MGHKSKTAQAKSTLRFKTKFKKKNRKQNYDIGRYSFGILAAWVKILKGDCDCFKSLKESCDHPNCWLKPILVIST